MGALSSWGQPGRHSQRSRERLRDTDEWGKLRGRAEGRMGKPVGIRRGETNREKARELEQDGEEGGVQSQSKEVKIR